MTRPFAAILWVLASLCFSGAAATEPALREQFAYSLPLELAPDSALQRLELPLAVYRDSIDANLRDLRVLNGNGEVVPFALQRPPSALAQPSSELGLPLFPLRGDPVEALSAFSLDIRSGSTSVAVQGGAQTADGPLVAYLIDAQRVPEALETLSFELPADSPDFSVTAVLEVSDDLAQWSIVAAPVPLARLRHGGALFENRSVTVRPTRARFWRLSARPGDSLPGFTGVLATRVAGHVAVDRQVLKAAGRPVADAAGEYLFDLGAQVPVDRLELELPDINTVAQVEYFARRAPGEPWHHVAHAAVHRLQITGSQSEDGELRSAPLAVSTVSSRYWRVAVDPRGGGLGAAVPTLRAGWLAHRVLFVARGAGPFELVYGNVAAENAEVALDDLLPGDASSADAAAPAQPLARAGSPRLAGGRERLQAPPPAGNWRLGLLWTALGVGVLTLGAVAWRLARQMRAGSS